MGHGDAHADVCGGACAVVHAPRQREADSNDEATHVRVKLIESKGILTHTAVCLMAEWGACEGVGVLVREWGCSVGSRVLTRE
jgi:hypothetical protein